MSKKSVDIVRKKSAVPPKVSPLDDRTLVSFTPTQEREIRSILLEFAKNGGIQDLEEEGGDFSIEKGRELAERLHEIIPKRSQITINITYENGLNKEFPLNHRFIDNIYIYFNDPGDKIEIEEIVAEYMGKIYNTSPVKTLKLIEDKAGLIDRDVAPPLLLKDAIVPKDQVDIINDIKEGLKEVIADDLSKEDKSNLLLKIRWEMIPRGVFPYIYTFSKDGEGEGWRLDTLLDETVKALTSGELPTDIPLIEDIKDPFILFVPDTKFKEKSYYRKTPWDIIQTLDEMSPEEKKMADLIKAGYQKNKYKIKKLLGDRKAKVKVFDKGDVYITRYTIGDKNDKSTKGKGFEGDKFNVAYVSINDYQPSTKGKNIKVPNLPKKRKNEPTSDEEFERENERTEEDDDTFSEPTSEEEDDTISEEEIKNKDTKKIEERIKETPKVQPITRTITVDGKYYLENNESYTFELITRLGEKIRLVIQ